MCHVSRSRPLVTRLVHTVSRLLGGRKAGLGDRRRHNERLLELLRPSRWVEDPLVQGHSVLCRYKPDTVDTVARETQFSKEEVKCLYRAFKQECPTGEMGIGMYFMIFICASTGISDEETFKEVYQKIFPLGDSSKYAGLVFRLELETKVHPKVRNHGECPTYKTLLSFKTLC